MSTPNIIVLGTSSGTSTKTRSMSATLLKLNKNTAYLFDASDGVTDRIKKSKVKLSTITKIFITHAHSDHFAGLFALLSEISYLDKPKELELFLPDELKVMVESFLSITSKCDDQYDFITVKNAGDLDDVENIYAYQMVHSSNVKCYGFVILLPEPKPKLDVEKLKHDYILPIMWSSYYSNDEYTIPTKRKVYIHFGDNESMSVVRDVMSIYDKCDVTLYHEGTYTSDIHSRLKAKGCTNGHTSVYEISKTVADLDQSVQLVISHFSPMMYKIDEIHHDVALTNKNVYIAYDNFELEL